MSNKEHVALTIDVKLFDDDTEENRVRGGKTIS